MPTKNIPQEHRDTMVTSYLAGTTANEAASQFGYSYMACIFALKQKGIVPRTNGETHRKYVVDETFFDTIDTEAKAYWLGFLTADGTIGYDHIILALQEKDISHLHKLTTSLGSNHPVITRENKLKGIIYCYGQVHIGSKRLATALKHLGVGERKSFTVRPCEHVTEALLHHYWRGVFDGDGFITLTRSRKVGSIIWLTGLVGNKEMVTGFESFMQRFVKAEAIIKPHHRIFMIRYGGVALPQTILRVLYQDATIFLTRKHARMNEVMNTAIQRVKS